MPKYVVLYKFTDDGIRKAKDTVQNAQDVRTDAQRRGVTVIGQYWTMGEYDLVTIVDAPDEDTVMAGLLSIGAAGNARSSTLRAFDETEMTRIIQKL
jgi:uncharacterized protein with GYD domain